MFRPLVCEKFSCGTSSPKKMTRCLRKLFKWINNARQRVWANYSSGTNFLDRVAACLIKLLKWNIFPWYRDSLSEKKYFVCLVYLSQLSMFVSTVNQKDAHTRRKNWILHRLCNAEDKSFRLDKLSTSFFVVNQSKLLTTKPRLHI